MQGPRQAGHCHHDSAHRHEEALGHRALHALGPEAHGKLCEIDAINGIVCREGRKHGVKTPINDRIVEVVKEIQEGERKACGENVGVFEELL